jgi:hypothetical protein
MGNADVVVLDPASDWFVVAQLVCGLSCAYMQGSQYKSLQLEQRQ